MSQGNSRSNYIQTVLKQWVVVKRPDVIEAIRKLAEEKFPLQRKKKAESQLPRELLNLD